MTPFVRAMLILFIIAWIVGMGGWFYGTRFFLPGYRDKALKGYAIFVGAIVFALVAGGLAQLVGGWE